MPASSPSPPSRVRDAATAVPVSFFGIVLGLAGLGGVHRDAAPRLPRRHGHDGVARVGTRHLLVGDAPPVAQHGETVPAGGEPTMMDGWTFET